MAATSVPDDEKRRVEAEFMQRLQEQMQQLSVYDHLVGVLQTLSSLAFQHLGVTPESAGQRDLEQSRLAIDAFRALTEILVPLRPSEEVVLYRSTLSQMQLAYVAELERDRQPDQQGTAGQRSAPPVPPAEPGVSAEPGASAEPGTSAEPGAAEGNDKGTAAAAGADSTDEEER